MYHIIKIADGDIRYSYNNYKDAVNALYNITMRYKYLRVKMYAILNSEGERKIFSDRRDLLAERYALMTPDEIFFESPEERARKYISFLVNGCGGLRFSHPLIYSRTKPEFANICVGKLKICFEVVPWNIDKMSNKYDITVPYEWYLKSITSLNGTQCSNEQVVSYLKKKRLIKQEGLLK